MNSLKSDDDQYRELQEKSLREWEELCLNCGACCGIIDGDPCEHLRKTQGNMYFCEIYENRLGIHRTLGGKEFKCVPIRDILHKNWPGSQVCSYKKVFLNQG